LNLPRDLSGPQLARLVKRYGYEVTRQTGSHLRLTSKSKGTEHHITIPSHDALKIGTLSAILSDVAAYLEIDRATHVENLFSA
jgi:predicted RNA binding protein YcfA (HicA-like mRNA interferase family)